MIKRIRILFFLVLALVEVEAQEVAVQTFRDTRIVNGHSVETNNEGVLKFIISHRFGAINGGIQEFFGLDQSTIRLGLDYGITDWATVGLGRNSFEKTLDSFTKIRIFRQKNSESKVPFTLTTFSSIALNTLPYAEPERENYFTSRLTFSHQLLLARKFNEDLSVQLMPTLIHRNLVPTNDIANDVISCGLAFRYQLTRNWALSGEYYYVLPDQLAPEYFNPVALGFEVETRGHIFQLQFGNARGMIEKFFITETVGDVTEGDIHFGFNITRDFKIKGKKY